MNNDTPRIRSLIRQAKRNVEAGKFAAAEAVYRQIVLEKPESSIAWLGLAQVTRDPQEKEAAFNQVLKLEQGNEQALAGLKTLEAENLSAKALSGEDYEQSNISPEQGREGSGKMQNKAGSTDAGPLVYNQTPSTESHYHGPESDLSSEETLDHDSELFCYRHPTRSTSLRCYKCNKPICSECAVKTPVGYLCPTCHREAEDAFFNNKPTDYILAALVALPLSLIAGLLVWNISARGGFFIILIFIFAGGAVGGFIARLSKRAIGKRRGRFIPHVVAACIIIGVLFFAWPLLLALFAGSIALFPLAAIGVYLFTAASSAFYWAR
jgi:hypothetical protein